MINNFRFELSFKNLAELEKKLKFCISNKINKINIPCKGVIKKVFLNQIMEYIGENYKNLDVIYHYSLYHQYTKNKEISFLDLLNFIKKNDSYNNQEILLVSGSNKKKNFEVLDVLGNFKNDNNLNTNFGVAYNPYLENYYGFSGEKIRFERKISSGLVKSIWLQFGPDIKLLESEVNFLKSSVNNICKNNFQNVKFYGSLLIPSRQFVSRFKFRPWKGVYISDKYLNSLKFFNAFTKDLIQIYLDNNICPVIETDFTTLEKLETVHTLLNK